MVRLKMSMSPVDRQTMGLGRRGRAASSSPVCRLIRGLVLKSSIGSGVNTGLNWHGPGSDKLHHQWNSFIKTLATKIKWKSSHLTETDRLALRVRESSQTLPQNQTGSNGFHQYALYAHLVLEHLSQPVSKTETSTITSSVAAAGQDINNYFWAVVSHKTVGACRCIRAEHWTVFTTSITQKTAVAHCVAGIFQHTFLDLCSLHYRKMV